MHGVLISVEFARNFCEHRIRNVVAVTRILQFHEDHVIAALHSLGVVVCVRVSRNNQPCVFQNFLFNIYMIWFFAEFGDAVVVGLFDGAGQNAKSNSKAAVNRYEPICVGIS